MTSPLSGRALALAGIAAIVTAGMAASAPAGRAAAITRPHGEARASNLLVNPGAEAGDSSRAGWDAVTIPGWKVRSGLPTVVRYGAEGFPSRTAPGPADRGRQMFAGGAGGTSELTEEVPVKSHERPSPLHYELSGWLGGTRASSAEVEVRFLAASGAHLGLAVCGPVGGGGSKTATGLYFHRVGGTVPARAVTAEVAVVLRTSLTDFDGPGAPRVGYNRAVADDLSFSLSWPSARPPLLKPPAVHVPRYSHVFLYYFENEDYGSVIGNFAKAPYLNSLLPRASLLADLFAEEHPSDGNYLALAGGSTFGIPLTDPLEENPHYTIDARNIGDLIDHAHESWKGYLQSADGPCDDTVHGPYWDDDLPFFYFRDVRQNRAYCSAHLVPLRELSTDLKKTSTTPSFSWLSPNDCADMEGCGITAGDKFLADTLGKILRSPAFTTQRSLVIITFDEDGYDYERPAQRVATIVLGSSGVRRGYVSHTRYTHYSLLRTIEAALGLGTLTDNDRYARPVNDVFDDAR